VDKNKVSEHWCLFVAKKAAKYENNRQPSIVNRRSNGLSLMEILVTVSIMAILMGISIPAAKSLMASFESGTGARQLINAALSNARAIAVREQTYAGVRFQQDAAGHTYIVFIVHDPAATGDAEGFRAVTGRKPMKMPEDITVLQTSVVFSPQGKLTIHRVQCLHGVTNDTVFNVAGADAMFADEAEGDVLNSVQSIIIGSKKEPGVSTTEYISPYTGELVMEYRQQKP
jgi:prepilin-type N-terminal cleavage/methylation domain-containing protein